MPGGTTPSERYLANLCRRSFLSLWSFANVFNDNGIKDGKGDGKEVCDLLVVFGSDVIIFSDKSCEFKDTGRLATDWNRWHRKAIQKSARQLYGAERWIRSNPDRLFVDAACTQPIPINLPDREEMNIHLVAVARGAKTHCQKFFGGGSGSLRISTAGDVTMVVDTDTIKAFSVSQIDSTSSYIHVLDDTTLDIILGELDTIKDFCGYLKRKEVLMERYTVIAPGEEELLALYLTNMAPDGEHGFGIPETDIDLVTVPEGIWDEFSRSGPYIRKKEADRDSYSWDRLIEYFNECVDSGSLVESVPIEEYEKGVRRMASLSRTERRSVGRLFEKILRSTKPNDSRYSAALIGRAESLAFVFVLFPPSNERTYDEYLSLRREILLAYCNIIRMKNPEVKEAVGIAMEPDSPGRGGSESLAFLDFSNWTKEQQRQAKIDQKNLRIKAIRKNTTEKEFPREIVGRKVGSRKQRRRRKKLDRQNRK